MRPISNTQPKDQDPSRPNRPWNDNSRESVLGYTLASTMVCQMRRDDVD